MVLLFLQDRTRISRFVGAAARHILDNFHHTLVLDIERIRRDRRAFATAMAAQVGMTDPEEVRDSWHVIGTIDGKFLKLANMVNG
jgi:hypothetical protein